MSHALEIRVTPSIENAIKNAPSDVSPQKEFTQEAGDTIRQWRELNFGDNKGHGFVILYDRVAELISAQDRGQEKIEALHRSLVGEASIIASNATIWQYPDTRESEELTKEQLEIHERHFTALKAIAAFHLLKSLIFPDTEKQPRRLALEEVRRVKEQTVENVAVRIGHLFISTPATGEVMKRLVTETLEDVDVQRFIQETIAQTRNTLQESPNTPVVRLMSAVFNRVAQFCKEHQVNNPLRNLTIGDVDGESLPEVLREKLGLNPQGPKALTISTRAQMYEQMYKNIYRYDISALGFPALRQHFIKYAEFFGLYSDDVRPVESMIGSGGSQTLNKAFLVSKKYLQARYGTDTPSVAYFPNPGLRMIASIARDAGLHVHEVPAEAKNRFFPDAESVDTFLTEHPECKIFINTPMGNPNGAINNPTSMLKVLDILKKHDMILINDLAYIGTGDIEENREVGEVLRSYEKRIDVIPMTKIFGRPSLRCAAAITPSKELAPFFMPVAQNFQPSESYAMQTTALSMWELISFEDRLALAKLYQHRQRDLIAHLMNINTERISNGKPPIIDATRPIIGDAALYVYVPLAHGVDLFDLMEETGLAGTPGVGFNITPEQSQGYVRFAVGVEGI